MKKEYTGECPECQSDQLEEIDYQHDQQQSTFWMRCEACKIEFKIESEWYVTEINEVKEAE